MSYDGIFQLECVNHLVYCILNCIPQISMSVQQQLTTAMDWPFVIIPQVPLTACVGLITLVMVCLVNLWVSGKNFASTIFHIRMIGDTDLCHFIEKEIDK